MVQTPALEPTTFRFAHSASAVQGSPTLGNNEAPVQLVQSFSVGPKQVVQLPSQAVQEVSPGSEK
jgi:hypothetical protein